MFRVLIPGLLVSLAAAGQTSAIQKMFHVRVPMRDGVGLYANIFRPAGNGRWPVILIRTPYGKGKDLPAGYQPFVEHGYALVIQDVRGRYDSEGVFKPLDQEPGDGNETLNWIAKQPWSNERIGMMGGSYLGIVQWKVATLNNPHLKAISPVVSGYDDYRDRFYSPGGAMKLGNRLLWMSENLRVSGYQPNFASFIWHLPLRTSDVASTGQRSEMYQKAVAHPAFDSFWQNISVREKLDRIRVPVFSIGGWYDNFVESDLEAFAGLQHAPHRSLIGPWPHNMSIPFPGVDFGKDSMQPVRKLQMDWFDYWLKSKKPRLGPPGAPLKIFVMGSNRWRSEDAWPPEGVTWVPFYLASKTRANSIYGDGELHRDPDSAASADYFTYDPEKPVPTTGGAVCCKPSIFPWGPLDQRQVEKRKDVLVYTSGVLKKDLEVIGPVRAMLYVSSSAPDTDFTAKLTDVFPSGEARNLTDGILRMRYRGALQKPSGAMRPKEVYQITIDAGVTANVFKAGHRVRLEISSSNFPRFDRNLNTGRPAMEETEPKIAYQAVFHTRQIPSHLLLPVMRPESESAQTRGRGRSLRN